MHYWNRVLNFFLIGVFAGQGLLFASTLSDNERTKMVDLHIAKCAKCHKLYDSLAYDAATWDAWMVKMKRKARLKEEQSALLKRYFNSVREEKK